MLIFDFDGTLVTLPVDWANCRAQLSAAFGENYSSIRECLNNLASEQRVIARDIIRRSELSEIDKAQLNETLARFVKSNRSYRFAILSNNMKGTIDEVLRRFSLAGHFEAVVSGDDVERTKPDPEGMLKLLRCFDDVRKDEILFIGDRQDDMEVGKRCGVRTIEAPTFVRELDCKSPVVQSES